MRDRSGPPGGGAYEACPAADVPTTRRAYAATRITAKAACPRRQRRFMAHQPFLRPSAAYVIQTSCRDEQRSAGTRSSFPAEGDGRLGRARRPSPALIGPRAATAAAADDA